jgi:hypothetical protein
MAQARLRQTLGWFAAGLALAGWLAGCSRQAPSWGSGSDYWVIGDIPPNEVWMPPDPAPLPDNRPRIIVPGGGGTLMEIGGDVPQLLAPAGDGTFMGIP